MEDPSSVAAEPGIGAPRVLITQGAPTHSPEKWAEAVAADIVRAPGMVGFDLRRAMTTALVPIFGLAGRYDVHTLTREAVGRVIACVSDSPWATHFVRAEREADLTSILQRHLTTARDVLAQQEPR